jgi:hypothetical protein
MATVRIQVRRGTSTQWTSTNPILAAGEMGVETNTNLFKFGNGTATWTALSYANNSDVAIGEISQDAINAALTMGTGLTKTYNDGANTITIAIDDTVWANKSYVTSAISSLSNTVDSTYIQLDDRGAANGVASLNAQGKVPTSETDLTVIATRAYAEYLQGQDLTALLAHESDTTNIHGIANTANLVTSATLATEKADAISQAATSRDTAISTALATEVTNRNAAIASEVTNRGVAIAAEASARAALGTTLQGYADAAVSTHSIDTTNVHGIADTLLLATTANVATAKSEAISAAATAAGSALSSHEGDTTNVHGISDTSLLALKSEVAAVTATTLGLGNVTNTSDANKPVSTAQSSAIAAAKAEAIADATARVDALLTGAPAALNTLDELAAALGDDANFASTVTTSLAGKVASYTPIIQKTAAYTLSLLSERDSLIEVGSASAVSVTIPPDSAVNYPIGTSVDILQTSTGQVTIAAGAGVTVNATPGLKLRTQWSSASLLKRAANTWIVMGDLSA